MQSTYVHMMLDRQKDEQRRWEKYKRQKLRQPKVVTFADRVKAFLRRLAAFLFTQVGVCALVVGYTIVGAFVFCAIEEERGVQQAQEVRKLRSECAERLWNVTLHLNILHKQQWERDVNHFLSDYQKGLVKIIKQGYDGKLDAKWTFPSALMYSLTVYTTIGYGNVTPKTPGGKIVTIMYALIGIPLMLLYMTNVGDFLGSSFKYLYSKYSSLCKCEVTAKRSSSRESTSAGARTTNNNLTAISAKSASPATTNPNTAEQERIERAKFLAKHKPVLVPASACLTVMFSYVIVGALVFGAWEKWGFIDGSYFCFVSLLTIGFGDLVPGQAVKEYTDNTSQYKLIVCVFYLLIGMSLIAMCFNLMQEEAIHKIRNFAYRIGLLRAK